MPEMKAVNGLRLDLRTVVFCEEDVGILLGSHDCHEMNA